MEGLVQHWFWTFTVVLLKSSVFRAEQRKQVNPGLAKPPCSGRSAELRPNSESPRKERDMMGTASLQTLWTCLPVARHADTFVVDTEVSLGEADVVVLVLGAPGSRQRRFVLINCRVQALQAPAQFLLPR